MEVITESHNWSNAEAIWLCGGQTQLIGLQLIPELKVQGTSRKRGLENIKSQETRISAVWQPKNKNRAQDRDSKGKTWLESGGTAGVSMIKIFYMKFSKK